MLHGRAARVSGFFFAPRWAGWPKTPTTIPARPANAPKATVRGAPAQACGIQEMPSACICIHKCNSLVKLSHAELKRCNPLASAYADASLWLFSGKVPACGCRGVTVSRAAPALRRMVWQGFGMATKASQRLSTNGGHGGTKEDSENLSQQRP